MEVVIYCALLLVGNKKKLQIRTHSKEIITGHFATIGAI